MFLSLSPLAPDHDRFAPLLGRSRVYACAALRGPLALGPEAESRGDLSRLMWLRNYDAFMCASDTCAQELSRRLDARGALIHVVGDIENEDSARLFWGKALAGYEEWRSKGASVRRPSKPRLGVVTPFPPERSGAAEYGAALVRALAERAVIDVFTDAEPTRPTPGVRRCARISRYPYVADDYDRVLTVLGNFESLGAIVECHSRYGGPCLAQDGHLALYHHERRGPQALVETSSRLLERPVEPAECREWLRRPKQLLTLFYDDVAPMAEPFICHSPVMQRNLARFYGRHAELVPLCRQRTFAAEDLDESSRIAAKKRLELPLEDPIIIAPGDPHSSEAPLHCVWALEHLHAWGVPAHLCLVGAGACRLGPVEQLAGRLDLARHVHVAPDWLPEDAYHSHLLAADLALVLRPLALGAASRAMMDCLSAGLPTVCNQELAEAMAAPGLAHAVPDNLSATLIAESLLSAYESGAREQRASPERDAYMSRHSPEAFASRMMTVLGLD